MKPSPVHTLDLNFLGTQRTIACYLIPHRHGAALIECGPASTLEALQAALAAYNLSFAEVSDVFLTHIHLDHAGAAGWLARQGARIHVHPKGAPHLLYPEKLLSSAARIYGEQMQTLWGEFLSVPEERLSVLQDGDVVEINGLRVEAIETPGHADHHHCYLYEDICFSGDIGGVRLPGLRTVRLPTPPPEFNLEKWRASLERLRKLSFRRIAPTHFGIFDDREQHLARIASELDELEAWMEANPPDKRSIEELTRDFIQWQQQRAQKEGVGEETNQLFEIANPSWMSPQGIQRYWRKYRTGG